MMYHNTAKLPIQDSDFFTTGLGGAIKLVNTQEHRMPGINPPIPPNRKGTHHVKIL